MRKRELGAGDPDRNRNPREAFAEESWVELYDMIECPMCGELQVEHEARLGQLSSLTYYRCEACHWLWHD